MNKKVAKIVSLVVLVIILGILGVVFFKGDSQINNEEPEVVSGSGENKEELEAVNGSGENKEESEKDKIKADLISEGEWRAQSVYSGDTVLSITSVYGTIVRYDGGITFYEDGTFMNSLLAVEHGQEDKYNNGKYEIDTENSKITYTFNDGRIVYGSYEVVDDKVNSITYEENFFEDYDYVVWFERKSDKTKEWYSLRNSLVSARWIPTSATQNGETVDLANVYGENYKETEGIMFDSLGMFFKKYVTEESNGIYQDYGFYWIEVAEGKITYQLPKVENDERVDVECDYTVKDGVLTEITFVENAGTENEIKVVFEPVVF